MPKKPDKPEPLVPAMFRLTPSLIARLDAHAQRMSAQTPGLRLTRTDALRSLLTAALDAAEGKGR